MQIFKHSLIISLLSLCSLAAVAQTTPKLVVEIVVGQMRYDYLSRFSHNFSQRGFNFLINEGVNCTDARYNYSNTSSPAALATISTGANPSMHGVVSEGWFDHTTNAEVSAIEDNNYTNLAPDGIYTHYAPTHLSVGTTADELKKHGRTAKVISVALDPVSSLIPAGRHADAAYWMDMYSGKWTTSTYYTGALPGWVEAYNASGYVRTFASRSWIPTLSPSRYLYRESGSGIGSDSRRRSEPDYRASARTPRGTEMVMDFARTAIVDERLGESQNTDLLIITIDPTRYISEIYGTESMETEDAYYHLDAQLGDLIEFIDTRIGMANVAMVLTSDHGSNDTPREGGRGGGGVFNVMQFRVLMGGFLNSRYGTDAWVVGYANRSLYLNRRLIFERGLDLAAIQAEVAAFATQFGGVAHAVTATALQNNYFAGGPLEKIQNGYYPRHSGDIVLNLMPGWIEDSREGVVSTAGSMYEYDTHVPLIWYGGGVGRGVVHERVDMTDLAPTLSAITGTNRPDASSGSEIISITSKFTK